MIIDDLYHATIFIQLKVLEKPYNKARPSGSSSRGLHVELDAGLPLRSISLRKRIDLCPGIPVDKLEFVGIEVDAKQFLVQLYKADEFGVKSHLYGLFVLVAPDIGYHAEFDLLAFVEALVPLSHQNIYNLMKRSP